MAAVVGRAAVWSGVGMDVEPWLAPAQADRLAGRIAEASELSSLRTSGPSPSPAQAATVAFSAMEACFKAIYPMVRRFFDCRDVRLSTNYGQTGPLVATRLTALGGGWSAGRAIAARCSASGGCDQGEPVARVSRLCSPATPEPARR